MLPLEGITVVSLEQAVAAPYATRQLADLGARVIKVERPGGDFARQYDTTVKGMSSIFVWLNRSKESIELDLKKKEEKEVLEKILENTDVFVQNLAPGATNRLGLSTDYLKEKYPELIICGISGYGTNGPYKDKKAYDLLIQCEAGLMSITGTEDTPSRTGISIADIAAGMYAYSGVLTAIIARHKTKQGTVLNVSMLEALGEWMSFPMYYREYGGIELARTGSSHAAIYPYGQFKVKNNQSIFLAIQNSREWNVFCKEILNNLSLVTDTRFKTNSDRVKNNIALKEIIEDSLREFEDKEMMAQLEKAGIANAKLNNIQEFIDHPQLQHRNRWDEIDSPVGKLKALVPPATFDNLDINMAAVPEVGEHTEKILKELGIDCPISRTST